MDLTSTVLIEANRLRKQETLGRLEQMRQAATIYQGMPESAYDFVVRVNSLEEGAGELEQKLRSYVE